jgi:hypothetical protein
MEYVAVQPANPERAELTQRPSRPEDPDQGVQRVGDPPCFTAQTIPSSWRRWGRIREVEFRAEGGGTGKALDIDDFDLAKPGYYQIVAWDPQEQDMVAMYRFYPGVAGPTQRGSSRRTGHVQAFRVIPRTFGTMFLPESP